MVLGFAGRPRNHCKQFARSIRNVWKTELASSSNRSGVRWQKQNVKPSTGTHPIKQLQVRLRWLCCFLTYIHGWQLLPFCSRFIGPLLPYPAQSDVNLNILQSSDIIMWVQFFILDFCLIFLVSIKASFTAHRMVAWLSLMQMDRRHECTCHGRVHK